MTFPSNQFDVDELEPDQYGGRPDGFDLFDGKAWDWLTQLVRDISARVLGTVRISHMTVAVGVQENVSTGHVLAVDLTRDAIDKTGNVIPYVAKFATVAASSSSFQVLGVAVAAASAGAKVQCSMGGALPKSVSLVSGLPFNALVSADPVTSKLRVFQAGDTELGITTALGTIVLKFPVRIPHVPGGQ